MFGLIDRLFLVKTIKSREGVLHFRRWRLLSTPWFSVFVHNISRSDEDLHPHNHPFSFCSFILKGGYTESVSWWDSYFDSYPMGRTETHKAGSVVYHDTYDYHKIKLTDGKPAWTLVFTGPRTKKQWGYLVDRKHVDHVTYRQRKHDNG